MNNLRPLSASYNRLKKDWGELNKMTSKYDKTLQSHLRGAVRGSMNTVKAKLAKEIKRTEQALGRV